MEDKKTAQVVHLNLLEEHPAKGLNVNISHTLTRSAHSLDLIEKRIIGLFLAQFDSKQPHIKKNPKAYIENRKVRVTAKDYAAIFEIDEKTAYRQLISAANKLFERYIRYTVQTPKGLKEVKIRWVSGVVYHHGEGWMEANFTEEVTPHIVFALGDKYTTYKLKNAASLRSIYSWRLMELMGQFKKTGLMKISLDKFRHALEIPEKRLYGDIKRKIIEPSIKELQDKNNLLIEWRPIKKGRAVASLEFKFRENEQIKLELDADVEPA